MTNEELVKALRILQDKNSLSYYKRQVCKDAAAVIEELDAEETRLLLVTSDLQDKLMDLQAEVNRLELDNEDYEHENRRLKGEIEALQAEVKILKVSGREAYFEGMAADAEPKLGKWVVKGANRIDCSVCGHSICFASVLSKGSLTGYNYCPKCGAKMEVQE